MAAAADADWMDAIRKKLIEVFEKDLETLVRVLHYLDEEEKSYNNNVILPPVWKTLRSTLKSEQVFKKYAERLAEDTKRAENDENFRETMRLLYEQMMDASEDPLPADQHQGFDLVRLTDFNVASTTACAGLAKAWSLIPRPTQSQILHTLPRLIRAPLVTAADEVVGVFSKSAGSVVIVGLAAVCLGWAAFWNVYRWWKGEISGKRCAKNVVDASFTVTAGAVGGYLTGAAVGAVAGPVGLVIGGVLGGVISYSVMNLLIDRLTQKLFDIPKDEALENAYAFLGVKMSSSNSEINAAFHRLCLKYHPDKPGGSAEDFHFLQLTMAVIKVARGEAIPQKKVIRALEGQIRPHVE